MSRGKHERLCDEGLDILWDRNESERRTSFEHRRKPSGVGRQRCVNIFGNSYRAVHEHRLSTDEHERQPDTPELRRQRGEEALQFRRFTDAH